MPTDTESRLKDLETALREKTSHANTIADAFKMEDGKVVVSTEQKADFDATMKDVREIRGLIDGLKGLAAENAWAEAPADESQAQAVAAGLQARGLWTAGGAKSLGQMFTDSPEFKALLEGGGYNMATPFEVKAGDLPGLMGRGRKDVYSDLPTGTPGNFGPIVRDPIVPAAFRTVRVRDLFPAQTTTASIIEYFRVTGFTNAASPVPERTSNAFTAKPQSGLTFKGTQAPVRTIAHWEAAHRNVLADVPQLQGIIDSELLYGLRLEEDAQILYGTGTGEDLEGIMVTTGTQSYDWSDGAFSPVPDNKADAIRRAATLSFLAYYEPTGVVVHPNDWEDIELSKSTTGEYLLAVSIALGGEKRVWRMPVVDTPAMHEGSALVGSFGVGAQLYDREQGNIRIAEQHADFFVRNAVVVLAEERLALATKRPESFVKIDFDAAPSD